MGSPKVNTTKFNKDSFFKVGCTCQECNSSDDCAVFCVFVSRALVSCLICSLFSSILADSFFFYLLNWLLPLLLPQLNIYMYFQWLVESLVSWLNGINEWIGCLLAEWHMYTVTEQCCFFYLWLFRYFDFNSRSKVMR